MAKIKLTKNELKTQRDALKRFERYLPTLQLKKQQLQMETRRAREEMDILRERAAAMRKEAAKNISLYASEDVRHWTDMVRVKTWKRESRNVAGTDVPVHVGVEFEEVSYDWFEAPLWLEEVLSVLRQQIDIILQLKTIEEQCRLLEDELRIVTQRVNLFEKVKIPEAAENIRRINIYIGDQQTNSVGRGKIAKAKCAARDAEL